MAAAETLLAEELAEAQLAELVARWAVLQPLEVHSLTIQEMARQEQVDNKGLVATLQLQHPVVAVVAVILVVAAVDG